MKISIDKLEPLMRKTHPPICPLCGGNKWNVTDAVFFLPEFFEDSVRFNARSIPVIPFTCTVCGNTLFVNAIIAGVLDKDDVTKQSDGAGDNNVG